MNGITFFSVVQTRLLDEEADEYRHIAHGPSFIDSATWIILGSKIDVCMKGCAVVYLIGDNAYVNW
jgi:hypothetical protein